MWIEAKQVVERKKEGVEIWINVQYQEEWQCQASKNGKKNERTVNVLACLLLAACSLYYVGARDTHPKAGGQLTVEGIDGNAQRGMPLFVTFLVIGTPGSASPSQEKGGGKR